MPNVVITASAQPATRTGTARMLRRHLEMDLVHALALAARMLESNNVTIEVTPYEKAYGLMRSLAAFGWRVHLETAQGQHLSLDPADWRTTVGAWARARSLRCITCPPGGRAPRVAWAANHASVSWVT